ncbi:MAG TPA: UPF0158 family protein [Verrucomicrobiae bacterium]|nr:UPF0158 family protein [Verrucomicrobiae bacterium]
MNPLARLSELMDALEFESVDRRTYFDRHTGRIVSVADDILSAVEEGDDEALTSVPGWQKEEVETAQAIVNHSGDRFIDPPGKFEFNEYRHMERFIGALPDAKAGEQLWRAIKGHGAFHHFKDTLYRLRIQDQWFGYRDEAMKAFVIDWAEANDVPYEDDIKDRKR